MSAAICASGEGRESETRAAVAAGTRAVAADNGYDRSTFAAGDKIRIIRSRNGSSSTPVDYILNSASSGSSTGEWKPSVTGTELLVESGATYQASYPIEYSGIRADQRKAGGEDYRLSNLLETPEKVTIGRDGTSPLQAKALCAQRREADPEVFGKEHTVQGFYEYDRNREWALLRRSKQG